ncbi:hypothetical protein LIER_30456 [Lithospermum erythrorhizon]|uniref:Uncharacterized protein n=1 Tax=Lithospermum erythrorhizon TaxID=34254 RepID=A0AAV3RMQ4_LITER
MTQISFSDYFEGFYEVANCGLGWGCEKASNGKLFEKQELAFDSILQHCTSVLGDVNKDNTLQGQNETRTTGAENWARPRPNFVKVNCDVGFKKEHNSGTMGIVCRDSGAVFK